MWVRADTRMLVRSQIAHRHSADAAADAAAANAASGSAEHLRKRSYMNTHTTLNCMRFQCASRRQHAAETDDGVRSGVRTPGPNMWVNTFTRLLAGKPAPAVHVSDRGGEQRSTAL